MWVCGVGARSHGLVKLEMCENSGVALRFFFSFTFFQNNPLVSKPLFDKPLVSKPLISEPLVSKPLVSKPFDSKPLASKPLLVSEPLLVSKPLAGANRFLANRCK